VSSTEARALYTRVVSVVRPLGGHKCKIIVTTVQRKSLWVAIDQITIDTKLLNQSVLGTLVPPVHGVGVG